MSNTKALTQLGFVTARGLDNGELGALLLSNKVGLRQTVREGNVGLYVLPEILQKILQLFRVYFTLDNVANPHDGGEEKELFEVERGEGEEDELQVS